MNENKAYVARKKETPSQASARERDLWTGALYSFSATLWIEEGELVARQENFLREEGDRIPIVY